MANDEIVQHLYAPYGKTTNVPVFIFIGKVGTQISDFYRLAKTNQTFKVYFNEVVPQRRKTYEQTSDARQPIYEQSVKQT